MRFAPLHERFGVEIRDVDLREVTATAGYPEIRAAFEAHSLLVFRDQSLDDEAQIAFGQLFGPIEDRSQKPGGPYAAMSMVSNRGAENTVAPEHDLQVQQLKANQLWHTDSTFLPAPALANVISARVLPSSGGETELVSTRAAWKDMPEVLKAKARDAVLWHRYSHSRQRISAELAAQELITKWGDQAWRAVWPNPANGEEALYIASHAFAIDGRPEAEGQAIIDELIAWCTQERYVYSHRWRPGDALVWDERATLHRGRPWPYGEERSMASICVTVRDCDGLACVRP